MLDNQMTPGYVLIDTAEMRLFRWLAVHIKILGFGAGGGRLAGRCANV